MGLGACLSIKGHYGRLWKEPFELGPLKFRADEVLKEKVLSNPQVKTLLRHRVLEIRGDGKEVRSVVLEDLRENKIFLSLRWKESLLKWV